MQKRKIFFRKDGSKRLVVPDHYKVRHTRYYGRKMGLTVLLQPAVHDYFAANRLSPGIRVSLSPPPPRQVTSLIIRVKL
jgi:hypothetical protein